MADLQSFPFYFFLKSFGILVYWTVWSTLIILIYTLLRRSKYQESSCPTIPGPKVPFWSPYGHFRVLPSQSVLNKLLLPPTAYTMQLLSSFAVLFEKEKLLCFRLAFRNYILLTKPESVEEMLTNNRVLEKAWVYDMLHTWLGTGLLTSHGSKWKSRRKLLTPSFHFDILKGFVSVFDEQSKVLVEILKQRHHEKFIDILRPVTLCSLDIICETTLGVHVGAQTSSALKYVDAVLRTSKATMERMHNPLVFSEIAFSLTSAGRMFKKDVKYIHNFAREVIQQRKATLKNLENEAEEARDHHKKKRKALLDLLLDIHMKNPDFTTEDIREEIDTFVFEGHDTTSMGVCWTLYLIGLHPEIQSKIHEELDALFGDDCDRSVTLDDLREMHYLECVLKEVLRLNPPVPLFGRNVTEDFHLCGYKIKKGSTIGIVPSILHRNSKIFPNPEKFDPDRFLPENCVGRNPFSYIPFSAGPRNCIGQRFAMLEEKTLVANVLRNFYVKSLEQRDQIYTASELILRSVRPLKLKFTLRDGLLTVPN